MMGLGNLIDPKTGVSDIGLQVREKTQNANMENKGASKFELFNPKAEKEGTGVTGKQELGKVETLLKNAENILAFLKNFLTKAKL